MSDSTKPLNRFWDTRAAALALALIQISALRLAITDWTPFLSLTQTIGFLGLALGLALGYSAFSARQARWFAFEYGLLLIPAQLLITIERGAWLYLDLHIIFLRLFDSVTLLIQNQPIEDPLFFVTLVSFAFWNLGIYAGYQLTRHTNFLAVTLPAGIIMLIVQAYDDYSSLRVWLIAAYIFIALILQGRLYFLQNEEGWKTKRIFFTTDTQGDISRVAFAFAAIIIFSAWIFPSALSVIPTAAKAWNKFTQPMRERFADAVSALDSPYKAPTSIDFYAAELKLGSAAPTSDVPVLYAEVNRIGFEPLRYYWRGRVYDQYEDGQWSASQPTNTSFNPQTDQLQPAESLTRSEAQFTFTLNFPKQELIYAPAEMIWINRASRVLSTPAQDSSAVDVSAWLSSVSLKAGESYQVRAWVSNPTAEDLRGAGAAYPQWVKDRYLKIPPEMQPQLKELAERVTVLDNNPYDKTQTLTNFLRKEIRYVTKIEDSPARGQDPMMWVLFEYKKGFCMYSATAEVLLLRSLGIPARMAVGFAQGTFDPVRRRYTVARLNSHAWPEVYFPNIGWVEFEPTGNQDPLERLNTAQPVVEEDTANPRRENDAALIDGGLDLPLPDANQVESENGLTLEKLLPYVYAVLLLGLVALLIFAIQRYSILDRLPVYLESRYVQSGRTPPKALTRWSRWARLQPIQRAFHSIDLSLRWLGHAQPQHATPLERANALVDLLPTMQSSIAALKEEHESALFTSHIADLERARRAARKIVLETIKVRLKKTR